MNISFELLTECFHAAVDIKHLSLSLMCSIMKIEEYTALGTDNKHKGLS